jgi:hypothetical protein
MSLERWIRLIAGSFVLISLALAYWVSPYWLWFTAFVGAHPLVPDGRYSRESRGCEEV